MAEFAGGNQGDRPLA